MPVRWLDVARLRARSLLRRARVDAELDRELRAHLAYLVDENVARGMTPEAARRAAVRTFGSVARVREEARDARGVAVVENLTRDLRHTLRGLRREPMLLIAATVSIALGVGGNMAVFSLARALVFAPPDVRHPEELVQLQVNHGSHATYRRWHDLNASGALEDIAGFSMAKEINWRNGATTSSVVPMLVTANFFDVTGVPVARGRAFTAPEASAERDPRVTVISHEFWQRELAGDSAVIGRTLVLNGDPYIVVGVLAPRLHSVAGMGLSPGVYMPLSRALVPDLLTSEARVVELVGRLRPGQTLAQGRAAVDAADRRLGRLEGDTVFAGVQEFAPIGMLGNKPARMVRLFFGLLAVVSLLVLLVACANVAGLLIARGTRRRQEIAIRLAIGGTRSRLVQQLLAEGFWLALLGTAAGLGLSAALLKLVNGLSLPVPLPIELHLGLDGPALLFALALVVLATVASALLPAVNATRLTLVPALKREEPFYLSRRFTARGALLTGQVAISTVLLVTALLFVRNLARTHSADPGFEVNHVLVARIGLPRGRDGADVTALLQRAAERVGALPGVERAAYASGVPLTIYGGSTSGLSARIDDRPETRHVQFARSLVGPGYFAALGVRVLAGREFRDGDAPGAPGVAIVNEEFARRYYDGRSPVGSRVRFVETQLDVEIVGVVANGKHVTIGEAQRAALYLPLRQHSEGVEVAFVLARTRGDPAPYGTSVRAAIGALDRSVAVAAEPMRSALAFALLPSRLGAGVLGGLGVLGLVLAAFGLYAIVSYNVSRRIAEIAVRTALGATRSGIMRLVVRDTAALVGVGLVLGLGLATLVTAPLTAFLVEGLSTRDPVSFAGTALVFLVVSLLASWWPARQATRVSPVLAMRLD